MGGNDKWGRQATWGKLYRAIEALCATRNLAPGFVPLSPGYDLIESRAIPGNLLPIVVELLESQRMA